MSDGYVRRAREQGYRSRAAFKLLEIDARERLLKPGARVLDLGAAPGGWSQVAAARVGRSGRVVAVDILEFAPISNVESLRGDVRDAEVRERLRVALGGAADVVLSDLSPNLSGIASVDQARAAELVDLAAALGVALLKPNGALLVKVFQGETFGGILAMLKREFGSVSVRKPGASRGESRETYLVARGPKPR